MSSGKQAAAHVLEVTALCRYPPESVVESSGVTRALNQGGKSSWRGPLAKTQKKLRNDSESLDVMNVHTR